MDTIRSQFKRFLVDEEQHAKWYRCINSDNRYLGRLRWWQERLWDAFAHDHPEHKSLTFSQICDAFESCHLHDARLVRTADCPIVIHRLGKRECSFPFPAYSDDDSLACRACTESHPVHDFSHSDLATLFDAAFAEFVAQEAEHVASGISERTLCGQLAIFLNSKIKESTYSRYYVDVEYNRKQNGQIKTIIDDRMEVVTINCDLIIHSRAELPAAEDNLIAIEMKKRHHPDSEKNKDRQRLRALTRDTYTAVFESDPPEYPEHVCGYRLGIYLELDVTNRVWSFEKYESGELVCLWDHRF